VSFEELGTGQSPWANGTDVPGSLWEWVGGEEIK
jgi:hypothetical protein